MNIWLDEKPSTWEIILKMSELIIYLVFFSSSKCHLWLSINLGLSSSPLLERYSLILDPLLYACHKYYITRTIWVYIHVIIDSHAVKRNFTISHRPDSSVEQHWVRHSTDIVAKVDIVAVGDRSCPTVRTARTVVDIGIRSLVVVSHAKLEIVVTLGSAVKQGRRLAAEMRITPRRVRDALVVGVKESDNIHLECVACFDYRKLQEKYVRSIKRCSNLMLAKCNAVCCFDCKNCVCVNGCHAHLPGIV